MGIIKGCLSKLSKGEELSAQEIFACFQEIIQGTECTPSQIGAFLMGLPKTQDMPPDFLAQAANAIMSFTVALPSMSDAIDIVGTGGDSSGVDTFNVSTAAGFIVGASQRLKVVKHGNRSASGKCGSADFVEALKSPIECDPAMLIKEVYPQTGFVFLFAQKCHPAMKSVGVIRRELGIRTLFNFLGPLTNPSNPGFMLVGVGVKEMGPIYAEVLKNKASIHKAMIVHSFEGMDEISPAEKTHVWLVDKSADPQIQYKVIEPADFGLAPIPLELVSGGSAEENAELFFKIMNPSNFSSLSKREQAVLDFLFINAAAAFVVAGVSSSFVDGITLARSLVQSGKAFENVQKYVKLTQANLNNSK